MTHYEILGVAQNATTEEIKQAYKKLAKEHHPDRGGNHDFFSKINAAYDVLKDPAKRKEYDQSFQRRFTTENFENFDFNFFNDFFEKSFRNYTIHKNKDIIVTLSLKLEEVFQKKEVQVNYKTSSGAVETTNIVVPHGNKSGDIIKITGKGDDADSRFPRGNLQVRIIVNEHPLWKRNNNDLWFEQKIDVFDLLLGCVIIITTLEGNTVKLNIPKASKTTSVFSIQGYGIPDRITGIKGNLYVKLDTIVPDITDESVIEKLKKIQKDIKNKETN